MNLGTINRVLRFFGLVLVVEVGEGAPIVFRLWTRRHFDSRPKMRRAEGVS